LEASRVDNPVPRWYLLGTTTNPHGVTHFTVTCSDDIGDRDYEVLVGVLKSEFGAVEDGQQDGPYSIHKYMKLDSLRFGIIIDEPDMLSLFSREQSDVGAMVSFVAKLLDALNDNLR
jgi:hypothetical protein